MLSKLGHKVMALNRIAVGPISLKGLGVGECRPLTRHEIELLQKAAAGASVPPPRFFDGGGRSTHSHGESRRPRRPENTRSVRNHDNSPQATTRMVRRHGGGQNHSKRKRFAWRFQAARAFAPAQRRSVVLGPPVARLSQGTQQAAQAPSQTDRPSECTRQAAANGFRDRNFQRNRLRSSAASSVWKSIPQREREPEYRWAETVSGHRSASGGLPDQRSAKLAIRQPRSTRMMVTTLELAIE